MLDVGGEGDPAGGVHVDVLLVRDVLLVHHVDVDPLVRILSPEDVIKALLKVFAVAAQIFPSILSKQQKLTLMGLKYFDKE